MKKIITKRRLLTVLTSLSLLILLTSYLINRQIDKAYNQQIYTQASIIPANKIGLLLGTAKTFNGMNNLYFTTRINATARLYHAKKIDKIVASGDNSRQTYDEASDMQEALIQQGVKAEDIYLDYAGFRTLDSVVRLKKVFNVTKVTIISQRSHCQRALFIADNHQIDAIAFEAKDVIHAGKAKLIIREYLARVKAWIDVKIIDKSPKFLGKMIEIQ